MRHWLGERSSPSEQNLGPLILSRQAMACLEHGDGLATAASEAQTTKHRLERVLADVSSPHPRLAPAGLAVADQPDEALDHGLQVVVKLVREEVRVRLLGEGTGSTTHVLDVIVPSPQDLEDGVELGDARVHSRVRRLVQGLPPGAEQEVEPPEDADEPLLADGRPGEVVRSGCRRREVLEDHLHQERRHSQVSRRAMGQRLLEVVRTLLHTVRGVRDEPDLRVLLPAVPRPSIFARPELVGSAARVQAHFLCTPRTAQKARLPAVQGWRGPCATRRVGWDPTLPGYAYAPASSSRADCTQHHHRRPPPL